MTFIPSLVVVWLQFAMAAALFLGLAAALLRRVAQPADRRTLVQVACATGVLALPWLAWGAGSAWRIEFLPGVARPDVESSANAAGMGEMMVPPSWSLADPPAAPRVGAPSAEVARAASANREDSLRGVSTAGSGVSDGVSGAAASGAWNFGRMGWSLAAAALFAAHAGMGLWFVVRRGQGVVQWRQLVRAASPASADLQAVWDSLTGARGRHVQLLVSTRVDSPLLCGWWSPVVLVPAAQAERGGLTLRSCLAHEWSHVAHGDYLAWRWVDAAQLVLWMIPAYWTLRRELRLSQDMLADQEAVRATGDAIEYSALLVDFARQRQLAIPAGSLALLDRPSQLARRVTLLLDSATEVRTTARRGFVGVSVALALGLTLLAGAVRIDAVAEREVAAEEPAKDAGQKPAANDAQAKPTASSAKYRCRVVDASSKQGVAGAKVTVRRSLNRTSEDRLLLSTTHTTDAEGYYDLEIPADQVDLGALYVELDVEHPEYPAKRGFGYSYAMIRKNEKFGERPFFEHTELQPGEVVTGRAVDSSGKPLANIKVSSFSMFTGDFNTTSWANEQTDQDGRFRIVMLRGAEAVLWVFPKDLAPVERFLAKQRGDLGDIVAPAGLRVKGQMLGVDGKPVAGFPVNITFSGEREASSVPVVTGLRRGAISDREGRFEFDPLPPGDYRLSVDDHLSDPLSESRTRHSLSAVFLPLAIKLKANEPVDPLVIQAVPHVVVKAQYRNSAGQPTSGHEFHLFGEIDGQFWSASGVPNAQGAIKLLVPHGLVDVKISLMTNEHSSLRYRRSAGAELQDDVHMVRLGTLNDDIDDFEIIRYVAPVLLVSAVDEQGTPIEGLDVVANYVKPRPQQYISFVNGSDIGFERQTGGVYRSSQMLPEEEMTVTVSAKGYAPVTEKVTLKESATRQLKVTLSKAAEEKPTEEKPANDKPMDNK